MFFGIRSGARRRLIDTSRRRDDRAARRDRSKARGRSRGEIPDKVFRLDASGGMKPRGASGARRAHTAAVVRGLPSRVKPRSRGPAGRPVASATGNNAGGNGRWVLRDGNGPVPRGRRKLRRVNPRSAAGTKQGRRGFEESKPSRGRSNPEGGTTRAGRPASGGSSMPHVLKGAKAQERCRGRASSDADSPATVFGPAQGGRTGRFG